MGVGKTTLGQLVAERLEREFIDIDQVIEKENDMTIPHIFERYGEAHFRKIERETIERILKRKKGNVIALGGGAFLQKEVRELCLAHGLVFFLDLPWEDWLKRYEIIKRDRPVLKNKNLQQIKALFDQRRAVYQLSHFTIQTGGSDPQAAAERIMDEVQKA